MGIELYTRRLGLLFATAALLFFPGRADAAPCPDQDAQPTPAAITMPRLESSILCLLNQRRTAAGIPPLSSNDLLADAARRHSSEMRWNSFFSHESLDGSPFSSRITASGYLTGATGWSIGENLGWGSSANGTPAGLVESWMNSTEHRDNILNAGFREVGVGGDWGTPSDPNLLPSMIATTDFGSVTGGRSGAGSKSAHQTKKKKKKKKKRKRRRR